MSLKSINPYNNQLIREHEEFSDGQVKTILSESDHAFRSWKNVNFSERAAIMAKAASVLREDSRKYASAITSEMGKPLKEALQEIEKCAWVCDYYTQNTHRFLEKEIIESDADSSYVTYEPLGTILGIMPWNFPFWQAFRFAVPTMMAGNTVLLKHSSNVQLCAGLIENLFTKAGFPSGVFRNLVLGSSRIDEVIKHDTVKAVSLTGSEQAGRKVAATAGSVLKKCVLELGGSNAFIVFSDADPEMAVKTGIKARFQNAGQSCIAAKRFIIERKISDRFMEMFLEVVRKLKPGDPSNEETDIGPLCNVSQAELVEQQVKDSVSMGAHIVTGGQRKDAFYQPSVVTGVQPGMPLFNEEVFGPVAPVITAENAEEAIAYAADTRFGLGVSLFTGDLKRAGELTGEFPDGAVFINGLVKSDPRLPFGGTGHSGYGRELSSHGIREFVNVKTVWIKNLQS